MMKHRKKQHSIALQNVNFTVKEIMVYHMELSIRNSSRGKWQNPNCIEFQKVIMCWLCSVLLRSTIPAEIISRTGNCWNVNLHISYTVSRTWNEWFLFEKYQISTTDHCFCTGDLYVFWHCWWWCFLFCMDKTIFGQLWCFNG